MAALQFLKAGNIAALRRWVGKVGFNAALPHVAKHVTGGDTERAKKVVGKLKGMAKKKGELAPEHAYGRSIKKGGAEGAEGKPPASPATTDKDVAEPARKRKLTGGADMGAPLVPGSHYEPDEDQLGGEYDRDADDLKKGDGGIGGMPRTSTLAAAKVKRGFMPPATPATGKPKLLATKACGPKSIGTTRSGKDVFGMPSHSGHWKYTAEDHDDAARIHEEAGRGMQAAQHRHKARKLRSNGHDTSGTFAKSEGEGSRGGQVIGHTKSGHPIYRGGMTHSSRGRQLYGKTDKDHVHESPHLIEHEGKTWVRAGHNSDTGGVSYDEHDPSRHVIDKQHDYGDTYQATQVGGKRVLHLRGLPKKVGGNIPTEINDPHHGHLTVRGHNSDTNTSTYHPAAENPGWPTMKDEPAKGERARISRAPKKPKSFSEILQGKLDKQNKRMEANRAAMQQARERVAARTGTKPATSGPINIMDLIGKARGLVARQRAFAKARPMVTTPAIEHFTAERNAAAAKPAKPMIAKVAPLGSTRSGKPIQSHFDHPSHAGFTAEDHGDAAAAHHRVAKLAQGAGNPAAFEHHSEQGMAHGFAAVRMRKGGRMGLVERQRMFAKAGGEGSRGGRVTGHTKSGKPIYGEHGWGPVASGKTIGTTRSGKPILDYRGEHESNKDFTADDHMDAANVHHAKQKEAEQRGDTNAALFHEKATGWHVDSHQIKSAGGKRPASVQAERLRSPKTHTWTPSKPGETKKTAGRKAHANAAHESVHGEPAEQYRRGDFQGWTSKDHDARADAHHDIGAAAHDYATETHHSAMTPERRQSYLKLADMHFDHARYHEGHAHRLRQEEQRQRESPRGQLRAFMNREKGAQMPSPKRAEPKPPPGTQGSLFTRKASLFERQRAFVKAGGKTCAMCQKPMNPETDTGHQTCATCRKPRPADEARQTTMFGKARTRGEGSRGGKIIGHTRSGKPIYDRSNHPKHAGFTSEDHRDAMSAHEDAADEARSGAKRDQHRAERSYHEQAHKAARERESVNPATFAERTKGWSHDDHDFAIAHHHARGGRGPAVTTLEHQHRAERDRHDAAIPPDKFRTRPVSKLQEGDTIRHYDRNNQFVHKRVHKIEDHPYTGVRTIHWEDGRREYDVPQGHDPLLEVKPGPKKPAPGQGGLFKAS